MNKQSKKKLIAEALLKRWWTNFELCNYFGPSALRRVRDLRDDGWVVKKERIYDIQGKATFTWRYRI